MSKKTSTQRRKGAEMRTLRNPSGKTPLELARVFRRALIENGMVLGGAKTVGNMMFEEDVRVDHVLPLPHCVVDYERPSAKLREIIEEGNLRVHGVLIESAEQLYKADGFIVVGRSAQKDFSQTRFNKEGHFNMCSGGIGSWIIVANASTLSDAYQSFIQIVVERTAEEIEKGLAAK